MDGSDPLVTARPRAAAAPAIAAALVLAVAPVAVVLPFGRGAVVAVALAAGAAWCFRRDRMSDGAILIVALASLAAWSAGPFVAFLPSGTALVPAAAVLVLSRWRDPPSPPLPWLRLGRFGASGAVAVVIVALVAAAAWRGARGLEAALGPSLTWVPAWNERLWMAPGWTALDVAERAIAFGGIAALTEEAVFRGALQERLTAALGPWPGVIGQALAYAGASFLGQPGVPGPFHHGGVTAGAAVVLALAMGLLLGILRRLASGLFAPVVAHVLADVAIVLWTYWAPP